MTTAVPAAAGLASAKRRPFMMRIIPALMDVAYVIPNTCFQGDRERQGRQAVLVGWRRSGVETVTKISYAINMWTTTSKETPVPL